ncbi:glycoside hydrolase family 26 protein [Streptosporangium sp. NPDC000396]|uniref:glycoside hydrolase family 26 protein n=1 Tax=Streptosporangium sp. NPDC000396 TaxID=3366185 RepID=UPI003684AE5B
MTPPAKRRHARPAKLAASRWIPVGLVAALVVAAGVYVYAGRESAGGGTPVVPGAQVAPTSCAPTSTLVPPCGAWWGMHVPPDGDRRLVPDVTAMEKRIGRRLDLTISYHDMSNSDAGRFFRDDESELGADRILFLGWESSIWSENLDIAWRDIAAGHYDQAITDQAERVKKYGRPVLVGFDGEKDRDESGQTPQEYIAAYKRIVDGFRQAGATNALWVWGVTGYYPFRDRWKPYYPGDAYVDWISYDPYNFASCRGATWQDFEETVRPTYEWFQQNGFSHKPLILAEYGTESHRSDPSARADWYRDIPAAMKAMPNLKAIIQWNNTDKDGCDFSLTGPGVLESFAEAGKDPYFHQPVARPPAAGQSTG